MRTTTTRLMQVMIPIGALVVAITTATPALGKSRPTPAVRAIANPAARTQTGIVGSRVLMIRWGVRVLAALTAAAGQSSTVTIAPPDRLLDEPPCGVVVDDGVPF